MRTRRFFAGQLDFAWLPRAADEFEVFTEVAQVLFQHEIGAAFAALLRHARVIALAVQADAQVGAAFHADFAAAGVSGNGPRFATLVAVPGWR